MEIKEKIIIKKHLNKQKKNEKKFECKIQRYY